MQGRLIENTIITPAAVPINTTGAAVSSPWVDLRDARRVAIVIKTGAWAGGTPAVTLNQATTSGGAGSKALAFDTYYLSSLTNDIPTVNTVTNNTFNIANAANQVYTIELHAQDFDVTGGFQYLQLAIASPGANADLIDATFILYDLSYAGTPSTLRTTLT